MPMVLVPLEQIDDNPYQCRHEYGEISELAADILRHKTARPDTLGLQQIPAGRLVGDDGDLIPIASMESGGRSGWLIQSEWRIQLEFGHRRRRAFAHLVADGWHEYARMPVRLLDLTDEQMLDGVWSENHERRNLSAVEEAELLRLKLERGGGSQSSVATSWGLARSTIANRLRLLELPADIQAANRDGRLSERQCLALAGIVQLTQLAPPDTQWGSHTNTSWPPPAPAAYVAHALTELPASDAIRAYADRALSHAGKLIPPIIGEAALAGERVVQATCKGCRYRVNDYCLRHECMAQKRAIYIEQTLEAVTAETGWPVSDRAEDFPQADYDRLAQLRALHQAGAPANFVIRWQTGPGYYPLRPNGGNYLGDGAQFDDAGRNGVALGHRGALDAYREYLPADAPQLDIANAETVAKWEAESKRLLRRAEKAARAALAARCWGIPWELLQALLRDMAAEWIDDPDEVARLLIDHLWAKGGWRHSESTRLAEFQRIERLMSRANVQAPLLADHRAGDLRARAILALDAWYTSRQWEYMARRALPQVQAVASMFDAAGPWSDEDMAELRYELGRALADSWRVCAQTAESGAEVVQG